MEVVGVGAVKQTKKYLILVYALIKLFSSHFLEHFEGVSVTNPQKAETQHNTLRVNVIIQTVTQCHATWYR